MGRYLMSVVGANDGRIFVQGGMGNGGYTHKHARTHKRARAHARTRARTRTHPHTHKCTHAHAHTHMHARTNAHTLAGRGYQVTASTRLAVAEPRPAVHGKRTAASNPRRLSTRD